MFIGHFALGFGAKRWAPAVSLGTLFLAAQFADLLWPTLLAIYAANVWGPPPPGEAAIAWVGHAQRLLVLAAYGLDRHRAAV